MAMHNTYAESEPTRAEIDALKGPTVIEFGAEWCGYCQAAQPLLASAFADHPSVRHIKIADGKGKPLGRSFRVTLWPTLIFLLDGKTVEKLIRPDSVNAIRKAFAQIDFEKNS